MTAQADVKLICAPIAELPAPTSPLQTPSGETETQPTRLHYPVLLQAMQGRPPLPGENDGCKLDMLICH